MNELDLAKRSWEKSLSALSNALLDLTPFQGEDRDPVRNCESWQNLYYGQPNTSQAEKALSSRLAAFAAEWPAIAAQVAPLVQSAIDCAKAVLAAKAAPRQPRKRQGVSKYGCAWRGSWASQPVAPEAISSGDYLVLRYGKGHQLAYVVAPTSGVRLRILRLCSRGYTYAGWQESWISRHDSRIEGFGRPDPSDPKLP